MTTDISALALIKGQKVEAPYYLAECTECGKMYSSSKLIEARNCFDGDADCYCPHCNADDADIADLGSGEQPAAMAWNYQQARIDTLVEALEKAQQRIAELESRTVTVKLPQRLQPGADGWDDWYVHNEDEGEYLKFDDVLAMLTAAGIKVEAE